MPKEKPSVHLHFDLEFAIATTFHTPEYAEVKFDTFEEELFGIFIQRALVGLGAHDHVAPSSCLLVIGPSRSEFIPWTTEEDDAHADEFLHLRQDLDDMCGAKNPCSFHKAKGIPCKPVLLWWPDVYQFVIISCTPIPLDPHTINSMRDDEQGLKKFFISVWNTRVGLWKLGRAPVSRGSRGFTPVQLEQMGIDTKFSKQKSWVLYQGKMMAHCLLYDGCFEVALREFDGCSKESKEIHERIAPSMSQGDMEYQIGSLYEYIQYNWRYEYKSTPGDSSIGQHEKLDEICSQLFPWERARLITAFYRCQDDAKDNQSEWAQTLDVLLNSSHTVHLRRKSLLNKADKKVQSQFLRKKANKRRLKNSPKEMQFHQVGDRAKLYGKQLLERARLCWKDLQSRDSIWSHENLYHWWMVMIRLACFGPRTLAETWVEVMGGLHDAYSSIIGKVDADVGAGDDHSSLKGGLERPLKDEMRSKFHLDGTRDRHGLQHPGEKETLGVYLYRYCISFVQWLERVTPNQSLFLNDHVGRRDYNRGKIPYGNKRCMGMEALAFIGLDNLIDVVVLLSERVPSAVPSAHVIGLLKLLCESALLDDMREPPKSPGNYFNNPEIRLVEASFRLVGILCAQNRIDMLATDVLHTLASDALILGVSLLIDDDGKSYCRARPELASSLRAACQHLPMVHAELSSRDNADHCDVLHDDSSPSVKDSVISSPSSEEESNRSKENHPSPPPVVFEVREDPILGIHNAWKAKAKAEAEAQIKVQSTHSIHGDCVTEETKSPHDDENSTVPEKQSHAQSSAQSQEILKSASRWEDEKVGLKYIVDGISSPQEVRSFLLHLHTKGVLQHVMYAKRGSEGHTLELTLRRAFTADVEGLLGTDVLRPTHTNHYLTPDACEVWQSTKRELLRDLNPVPEVLPGAKGSPLDVKDTSGAGAQSPRGGEGVAVKSSDEGKDDPLMEDVGGTDSMDDSTLSRERARWEAREKALVSVWERKHALSQKLWDEKERVWEERQENWRKRHNELDEHVKHLESRQTELGNLVKELEDEWELRLDTMLGDAQQRIDELEDALSKQKAAEKKSEEERQRAFRTAKTERKQRRLIEAKLKEVTSATQKEKEVMKSTQEKLVLAHQEITRLNDQLDHCKQAHKKEDEKLREKYNAALSREESLQKRLTEVEEASREYHSAETQWASSTELDSIPLRSLQAILARSLEHVEAVRESIAHARIVEAVQEATQCVVCYASPRAIALLPCEHYCLCESCASHCQVCPTCGATIKDVIRLRG